MTTKVHIASSRWDEIGRRCTEWALENMLEGFEAAKHPEDCDIFISVLYDKLITREFISTRRCYNFHPGLLPDYRGAGAYSWALINKEKETGVTLHEIDEDIDHGRIISQVYFDIKNYNNTAGGLFNEAMDTLYEMFQYRFPKLLTNDYVTKPNEGGHLYLREDLEVAKDITHIIRAFTFEGKESAYWVDGKGEKHYVEYRP